METWEGRRSGQAGAQRDFAANAAFDISLLDDKIPTIIANKNFFIVILPR